MSFPVLMFVNAGAMSTIKIAMIPMTTISSSNVSADALTLFHVKPRERPRFCGGFAAADNLRSAVRHGESVLWRIGGQ